MPQLLVVRVGVMDERALHAQGVVPAPSTAIAPDFEARQRERTLSAGEIVTVNFLARIVGGFSCGEIPVPWRRCRIAKRHRAERAIGKLQQHGRGIFDRKSTYVVRGDGLHAGDVAKQMAQQVDVVNQVDHHRAAAGFAPPRQAVIAVRLEPGGHCIGGDGAAEHAVRHQLLRAADDRVVAAVVAGKQGYICSDCRVTQAACIGHIVSDGLFDQCDQAARNAVKALRHMQVVGRGDDHGVDLCVAEHLGVARIARDIDRRGKGACTLGRVRNRSDGHIGRTQRAFDMHATDATGTDEADGHAGWGRRHRQVTCIRKQGARLWNR